MAYENNQNTEDNFSKHSEEKRTFKNIFSKRVRAGKRRTYFFDVRETKGKDYFITITESKKRFNDDGYDRHKLFIYKEDFNKFLAAMTETIDHVKTELMPNFDFDAFNHDEDDDYQHDNQDETQEDDQVESITESGITLEDSEIKPIADEESVDAWKI